MTEDEWLTCDDSCRVVSRLRSGSDRKLRLVACALCRMMWVRLSESAQETVTFAEAFADGIGDESRRAWHERRLRLAGGDDNLRIGKWLPRCAVSECGWYAAELGVGTGEFASRVEVQIVRDIFGNPFRSVSVDSAWLTSTVVTLATGIYEQRAFDRMPILADALQDAGCEDADMLDHCRGGGPHVRGCWVVDLLLGKS